MKQTPPNKILLEDLKGIVNDKENNIDVILANPQKWIDWESAMTFMTADAFVVWVNTDSEWQLHISFSNSKNDANSIAYEEGMAFILRSKG